jgi:hypothetical protein
MIHECKHCHKKSENLRRCAACSIVWYCNSQCQKSDWPIHLVDCNPGRPITTADRLVAFVHQKIPPKDDQTCRDYGFTHTLGFDELKLRLRVYHVLIVELEVKAKTIHQWLTEGNLGKMMRETFDARLSLDRRRQADYLWFCDNQSTFDRDTRSFLTNAAVLSYNAHRTAWQFIGGNPLDSMEHIASSIRSFTADQRHCFHFIMVLLAKMRPGPGQGLKSMLHSWIFFGLCACATQEDETSLVSGYQLLILFISFDKFCQAYTSSSLPKLFADSGFPITNRFILDVLSSRNYKSVWYLKDFVFADDEMARNGSAPPSIGLDYGFFNCQNVDEVIALRSAYKQVLSPTDADPLALHEACLRGELFEYVKQKARLKPQQLFKRLMKNPYPLVSIL